VSHTPALITRWLGGLLLLMVPFVLVAGYWAPRGVQFLNPVVCEKGQHIANHGATPSDGTTSQIELTCRSQTIIVNATRKMLGVAAGFLIAGAAMLMVSARLTPHRISGPRHVQQHL
jgi:hypothetical protein